MYKTNRKLLELICDWYNYDLVITNKEIIYSQAGYMYNHSFTDIDRIQNMNNALKSWLDTLVDSDICQEEEGVDLLWEKEILYIEGLR